MKSEDILEKELAAGESLKERTVLRAIRLLNAPKWNAEEMARLNAIVKELLSLVSNA
jgi:hypothetical protein